MKSTKSNIILGGIATLLVVGVLVSVFALFVNEIKEFSDELAKDTDTETDAFIDADGTEKEDTDASDKDADTDSGSASGLDTFTLDNGRLGVQLRKIDKYNDGSGDTECYVLCIGTKEAPKDNTRYRIKWKIDSRAFTRYNCGVLSVLDGGAIRPALFRGYTCNNTFYSAYVPPKEIVGDTNSPESYLINLSYPYTTSEGWSSMLFGALCIFTTDYGEALEIATSIIADGYFTDLSITEEVSNE